LFEYKIDVCHNKKDGKLTAISENGAMLCCRLFDAHDVLCMPTKALENIYKKLLINR